jgi:hypothetical protein
MSIVFDLVASVRYAPAFSARRCTAKLPIQDSFRCHQLMLMDGPSRSVILVLFLRLVGLSGLMPNIAGT